MFAEKLSKKKDIVIIDSEKAFKLNSNDGEETISTEVPELHSTMEQTDTRVVLYIKYAMDNGFKHVVVHSPDSDIFFILLSYARNYLSEI